VAESSPERILLDKMISAVVASTSLVALSLLVARGIQRGFASRLPFFYSYLSYMLLRTILDLGILWIAPQYYAASFWTGFALSQIVEFAVLIEISDHIFDRKSLLHKLGRLLCVATTVVFAALYLIPALLSNGSRGGLILELAKRSILTKAVIIVVLLAARRLYKQEIAPGISGILLGFCVYLCLNIANLALAEFYGEAVYGRVFSLLGPLSWTLGSVIWVVTLWNYQEGETGAPLHSHGSTRGGLPAPAQLSRLNDALLKLLQK
jgi:hypothetical protein